MTDLDRCAQEIASARQAADVEPWVALLWWADWEAEAVLVGREGG